jgi:hypothetical protein
LTDSEVRTGGKLIGEKRNGTNLQGTELSRVAVTRPGGFPAGTLVSCTLCHEMPD